MSSLASNQNSSVRNNNGCRPGAHVILYIYLYVDQVKLECRVIAEGVVYLTTEKFHENYVYKESEINKEKRFLVMCV